MQAPAPSHAILELLKQRGEFIFTSNKEYWSLIEWDGNAFFSSYGDTLINEETERKELTEDQVLSRLRSHYNNKPDEEIYEFMLHYRYRL